MKIVVDTSVVIAVIVNEKHKKQLTKITKGASLIAPISLHWEIGNAFSVMFKRKRINLKNATRAVGHYYKIPLRFIEPDLKSSLEISDNLGIYAYDAYFIQCAIQHKAPLLSLDRALLQHAQEIGIKIIGVEK